jgi:carbamoyltransferase
VRHLLGISAYYHDSAAALLTDGRIVAAAQEERFSRRKNDERFPRLAAAFCLKQAGLDVSQLDAVVFYDKPITKFGRMLESYLAVAPGGWFTFPRVLPAWLGEKLNLRGTIRYELPGLREDCPILFTEHHQSHAASAFFPSPFDEAAILTVDGVGEWATTTIGVGKGSEVTMLQELRFPHSLGLLYSAFTAYCGFRINSGEYKLMGLAPYGEPRFVDAIYTHLVEVKEDGSLRLNLEYFQFLRSLRMTNSKFDQLFGGPARQPETPVEQRHMDVARSIQVVTEQIMLRLARHARAVTGQRNLCLAGGVALNCVANGLIQRERIFERMWIQPAARGGCRRSLGRGAGGLAHAQRPSATAHGDAA